jgi:integrase
MAANSAVEHATKKILSASFAAVQTAKTLGNRRLDDYLQTLEQDNYAKKTIETRMGVIFSMLKDYVRETGVEYPSKLVSLPEVVRKRAKAYSNDEIAQLFGAMDADDKFRYLFFLLTGCREQEVTYATWNDVDFRQRKFHVTATESRTLTLFRKITKNAGFR